MCLLTTDWRWSAGFLTGYGCVAVGIFICAERFLSNDKYLSAFWLLPSICSLFIFYSDSAAPRRIRVHLGYMLLSTREQLRKTRSLTLLART